MQGAVVRVDNAVGAADDRSAIWSYGDRGDYMVGRREQSRNGCRWEVGGSLLDVPGIVMSLCSQLSHLHEIYHENSTPAEVMTNKDCLLASMKEHGAPRLIVGMILVPM